MAVRRAAVAEGLTGDRDEREVIAGRMERQLQDAIGAAVADLGVGRDRREADERGPAGADHELSDPLRGCSARRGLWRESFVLVAMATDDDVRAVRIEDLPERHGSAVRLRLRRREPRVMEDRDRACGRVRREIGLEPQGLGRCRATAPDVGAVRVEHDGVPGPDRVAVVGLACWRRSRSEIAQVPLRTRGLVILVTRRRLRARLGAAPGRAIAVGEFLRRRVRVDVVPCGEYGPGDRVEELRRRLVL